MVLVVVCTSREWIDWVDVLGALCLAWCWVERSAFHGEPRIPNLCLLSRVTSGSVTCYVFSDFVADDDDNDVVSKDSQRNEPQ